MGERDRTLRLRALLEESEKISGLQLIGRAATGLAGGVGRGASGLYKGVLKGMGGAGGVGTAGQHAKAIGAIGGTALLGGYTAKKTLQGASKGMNKATYDAAPQQSYLTPYNK